MFAGSDCCSESSWKHCNRYRWADTGCAELWCIVSLPCTADTPKGEDMQGIIKYPQTKVIHIKESESTVTCHVGGLGLIMKW